jgi:XrtJ-associated TM-motif-TM protein
VQNRRQTSPGFVDCQIIEFAYHPVSLTEIIMKKALRLIYGVAICLLAAVPLRAQTGCTDSPENPTAVLALVGGAGALFSALRARWRRNSSPR